jgi:hypothetical protein
MEGARPQYFFQEFGQRTIADTDYQQYVPLSPSMVSAKSDDGSDVLNVNELDLDLLDLDDNVGEKSAPAVRHASFDSAPSW